VTSIFKALTLHERYRTLFKIIQALVISRKYLKVLLANDIGGENLCEFIPSGCESVTNTLTVTLSGPIRMQNVKKFFLYRICAVVLSNKELLKLGKG
jgi:hypothetical protein